MKKWLDAELAKELERSSYSSHVTNRGVGTSIETRGRKVIDFTSPDFLGLGLDPGLKKLFIASVEDSEVSSLSNRFSSGYTKYHQSFENNLAKFLRCESSLVFTIRNQAFLSLLSAITREGDLVIANEFVTSPVRDVASLSRAEFKLNNFNDLTKVKEEITKIRTPSKAIVFVEAISPVSGNHAPLKALSEICSATGSALIIDETYSLGWYGPSGSGACAEASPFAIVGSFGAGFSGLGGFIAGSASLCKLIEMKSRAFSNDLPIPPAYAAYLDGVLEKVIGMEALRGELLIKAEEVRLMFFTSKLPIISLSGSPIINLSFKSETSALSFTKYLWEKGILFENVPRGTFLGKESVVRGFVTLRHTNQDIERLKWAVLDYR